MRGLVLTISMWAGAAASAEEIAGVVIHGPPAPVASAVVTRDENGGATIRAVRLDASLVVDGRLDERIYQTVPAIGGFLQQDPNEGFPATEGTDVWVFFDEGNVYVSAAAGTPIPSAWWRTRCGRDHFGIFHSENLAVVFDTLSATTGVSGDSASYQGELDYDGDRYGLQLERLVV